MVAATSVMVHVVKGERQLRWRGAWELRVVKSVRHLRRRGMGVEGKERR
jgi:hypothetical protein